MPLKGDSIAFECAGKIVRTIFDGSPAGEVLAQELSLYPPATGEPDLTVVMDKVPEPRGGRNPIEHGELENGFVAYFGYAEISWQRSKRGPLVHFWPDPAGRSWRRKLTGVQYTHPYEEVGQIFHEVVLAWSLFLFFSDDVMLVHASAVQLPGSAQGIVIAGTGGVGKTSIELELTTGHGYHFVADDITFLSSGGVLMPHLAHPKVYAYNVTGDPLLKARMFCGRSLTDKWWWNVQIFLRGPSRTRRRVDPSRLFNGKVSEGCYLSSLICLFRDSSSKVPTIRSVDASIAAEMCTAVIDTELEGLRRHLRWHAYNRAPFGQPLWSYEDTLRKWQTLLAAVLEGVVVKRVTVPTGFSGEDVRKSAPDLIAGVVAANNNNGC